MLKRLLQLCTCAAVATGCATTQPARNPSTSDDPFVIVLGIAQDGGVPHAGCARECCAAAWRDPVLRRRVACLAIVDPMTSQRWIIECTPDFPSQLQSLDKIAPPSADRAKPALDGILITHAHIGHYAGLVHLGREVMGAKDVPVFAMPRMRTYLQNDGPWNQLVELRNIALQPLEADQRTQLNDRICITPFLVPHRDEYSETVGFRIDGPNRAIVFIPDIDKWEKWDAEGRRIEDVVTGVDVAYLDGTFFADGELPGRSMAEVPHPFIIESMTRFAPLAAGERAKIRFIHLNHTNPALRKGCEAREAIVRAGFNVAEELERQPL